MYVGGLMGGLTRLLPIEINCRKIAKANHFKEVHTLQRSERYTERILVARWN